MESSQWQAGVCTPWVGDGGGECCLATPPYLLNRYVFGARSLLLEGRNLTRAVC